MHFNFRKALPRKMADCTSEKIDNDDKILHRVFYSHGNCTQANVCHTNIDKNNKGTWRNSGDEGADWGPREVTALDENPALLTQLVRTRNIYLIS